MFKPNALQTALLRHLGDTPADKGVTIDELYAVPPLKRYGKRRIQDALGELRREHLVAFRQRPDDKVEWYLIVTGDAGT